MIRAYAKTIQRRLEKARPNASVLLRRLEGHVEAYLVEVEHEDGVLEVHGSRFVEVWTSRRAFAGTADGNVGRYIRPRHLKKNERLDAAKAMVQKVRSVLPPS